MKIGIPHILGLQDIVSKLPFVAVDDSPVVRISRLTVNGFKVERHPTGTDIILQEIIGTGIFEQLGKKTLSSHSIPVAAPQFTAEDNRAFLHLRRELDQLQVTVLNLSENPVGFLLFPDKQSDEFIHSACPNGVISLYPRCGIKGMPTSVSAS